MSVAEAIEHKIRAALPVTYLTVENESHRHSVPVNSETHFKLVLVSEAFDGQMPVRRHQRLYQVLAEELNGPIHALALHLFTPQEWSQRQGDVASSPDCRGGSKHDPEFQR